MPQNNLLIFASHFPPLVWYTSPDNALRVLLNAKWPSLPNAAGGTGTPYCTWPQDVRINLTASAVGQDGPPLPFDVS